MDNRPIGIFDSGLGGLTAVKELERLLPNEDIIYFGDTGRVPYGSKSRQTLLRYTAQDIAFLKSHNVKAIMAACGTVSTVANEVGEQCGVLYVNVLHSAAAAAAAVTKNKRIGVIATTGTILSGAFRREILRIDPEIQVFEQACPLFVPLVENGYISPQDEVTRLVAERDLAFIRAEDVDALILGCTHFPIIESTIANVMGKRVKLINSGLEASRELERKLRDFDMLCTAESSGTARFFVSDIPDSFANVAEIFLGHDLTEKPEWAPIETY